MTSLLFFCALLSGCGGSSGHQTLHFSGNVMGTSYHITVVADASITVPADLGNQLQRQLETIDNSMSTYKPNSELSRLNGSEGADWQPISAELFDVLAMALQVSRASGGAFDVTVAPLVDLWGFGPTDTGDRVPTDEEVNNLLAGIGYDNLELRESPAAIKKRRPVRIDLSAIAKGYAADYVGHFLLSRGYGDYLVEIGGDLLVRGRNPTGEPWRIGVEQPAFNHEGVQQAIAVTERGIATSGDYRNYFEVDGRRYSHTIDPQTGRPITHNLASVTVIADNGALADAWATAFNVLGVDKAKALADELQLAAYFIVKENDSFITRYSAAMSRYLPN